MFHLLQKVFTSFKKTHPSIGFVFTGKARSKYAVHVREGWLNAAQELGLHARGYYAGKRKWDARRAVKYLNRQGHDVVFLIGGDWHLYDLHMPEGSVEAWSELRVPTVCVCDERIAWPEFPDAEQRTRSALESFSFFAFTDEAAEPIFHASGKPHLWIPQYIDAVTIRQTQIPATRKPYVYFRGQINQWGIASFYNARRHLYEALQGEPNVVLEEAYKPHLKPSELLKHKASFAIYLHLPSNHPGYVTSFMEAGALGVNVMQHEIADDLPRTAKLFQPGQHFIPYQTTDVEGLKRIIQERVREIGSPEMKAMAESLQELVMREHTLTRRLATILDHVGIKAAAK